MLVSTPSFVRHSELVYYESWLHEPLVRLDQSAGQLFLPWKKARQLVDRGVELALYAIPGRSHHLPGYAF